MLNKNFFLHYWPAITKAAKLEPGTEHFA